MKPRGPQYLQLWHMPIRPELARAQVSAQKPRRGIAVFGCRSRSPQGLRSATRQHAKTGTDFQHALRRLGLSLSVARAPRSAARALDPDPRPIDAIAEWRNDVAGISRDPSSRASASARKERFSLNPQFLPRVSFIPKRSRSLLASSRLFRVPCRGGAFSKWPAPATDRLVKRRHCQGWSTARSDLLSAISPGRPRAFHSSPCASLYRPIQEPSWPASKSAPQRAERFGPGRLARAKRFTVSNVGARRESSGASCRGHRLKPQLSPFPLHGYTTHVLTGNSLAQVETRPATFPGGGPTSSDRHAFSAEC